MRRESCKVIGIMVHIVPVGGLTGAAVATAIMGDHAITMFQEEQHLVVPVVRAERPAMTENHGLSGTPILIKNRRAIFDGDRAHNSFSSFYQANQLCPKAR